jgi:hypothetical protein
MSTTLYLSSKSFSGFFKKIAKFSRFKKKGILGSFYIGGDQLKIVGKKVKIPSLGWVSVEGTFTISGKD